MALNVYSATNLPELAENLAGVLRRHIDNSTGDPLRACPVIVPGGLIQEWLRLDLVNRFKGSLNLEFNSLPQGLWSILQQQGKKPQNITGQLTCEHIQNIILSILISPPENAPSSLEPVWQYIYRQTTPPGCLKNLQGSWWRRAWQLAETMAAQFFNYELEGGIPDLTAATIHPHYAWQKDLFALVSAATGRQQTGYPDRKTLKKLIETFESESSANGNIAAPLTLFGFGHLPVLAIGALQKISAIMPVAVFLLQSANATGQNLSGNDILSHWSVPVSETIRELSSLQSPEPVFHAGAGAPAPTTNSPASLLDATRSLLAGKTTSVTNKCPQDRSLQIWACPGQNRETDTVVQLISGIIDEGTLPLNEVAVLLAAADPYATLLSEALKGAEIPFNTFESSDYVPEVFGAGVEALFNLAEDGFTRAAVFRLLTNPCWQITRQAEPGMVEDWLKWADKLGIFAGFTTRDKCISCQIPGRDDCSICFTENADKNDAAATQAHTWQLALRRLRLGLLMELRQHDPEAPLPLFAGCSPYQDFASTEPGTLQAFSTGVEILHAMVKPLGGPGIVNTPESWSKHINQAIHNCLATRQEHPEDIDERNGILSAVYRLESVARLYPGGIPFEIVREMVLSGLKDCQARGSRPFMRGLTLAPLSAAAAIPWRQAFVVGLGEDLFPGGGSRSSLNLFAPPPGLNSITAKRWVSRDDFNRQAFLHTLLATREKLILTYSDLDPKREAELNPASVIWQLQEFLEANILPGGCHFEIAKVPAAPLSTAYLVRSNSTWHDSFHNISRATWLTAWVMARQNPGNHITETPEIALALTEATDKRKHLLPAKQGYREHGYNPRLRLKYLANFLKDPASATLRRWIHFDNDDTADEWSTIETAPLKADFFVANGLVKNTLFSLCARGLITCNASDDELLALFNKEYDWEQARSRLSDGLWSQLDRNTLGQVFLRIAHQAMTILREQSLKAGDFQSIAIGCSANGRNAKVLPPIRLSVDLPAKNAPAEPDEASRQNGSLAVELAGTLPMAWIKDNELHQMIIKQSSSKLKILDAALIESVLTFLGLMVWQQQHAQLTDQTLPQFTSLYVHAVFQDHIEKVVIAPQADFASQYLPFLVNEYLNQKEFHDLRLRIVTGTAFPPTPGITHAEYHMSLTESLERQSWFSHDFDSSLFKSIGEPAIPANALDLVNSRLTPLCQIWRTIP